MLLYRIVQDIARTTDLSGAGAFRYGGRWNSKGTYMLYTSANSSLAYLESLVHFDPMIIPPKLYITELQIMNDSLIHHLPEADYHKDWKQLSLIENQLHGDRWMNEKKWLGISVRSAINEREYNYLLNPLYSGFHDLVKLISVNEIEVDNRLT